MGYQTDYGFPSSVAVAGTGAVTIVPASGDATTRRNLATLIVTTPNAAAATLTLNDGSSNVGVFNYPNAAAAPGTPLTIEFLPPLRQASANTAWTLTASANLSGFNVVAEYVEEQ